MPRDEATDKQAIRAEFAPGSRIGRYQVHEPVGIGGMGTVYKAFDETTNRYVAVKVLAPGLGENLMARFQAESDAEGKIRHPNVMPVYDRGAFAGRRAYFVMELVYEPITLGELSALIQRGAIDRDLPRLRHWADPGRLIADVVIPVCEGVDAANRQFGVVHRDIKPDNVLIDARTRRPYLIDFGICHHLGQPPEIGRIVGTPRFLSPEQAIGGVNERTDVFGLGALLAFILTGEPPIEGAASFTKDDRRTKIEALLAAEHRARQQGDASRTEELFTRRLRLEDDSFRTIEDMVRDAREGRYLPLPTTVPAALAAIVRKAMARFPVDRYESAAALAEDLRAWLAGGRVQALAETAAAQAAQAARRTLRRVAGIGAWVAAGLVVGFALGQLLGRPEASRLPPGIDHAEQDLAALEQELAGVGAAPSPPAEASIRYRRLARRADVVAGRLAGHPDEPRTKAAADRLAALRARLDGLRRPVQARDGSRWSALDVLRSQPLAVGEGGAFLAPGPWRVVADVGPPFDFPYLVPLAVAPSGPVPVLRLPSTKARIPPGMVLVPPTGSRPAFAISGREVTNAEYAEWLAGTLVEERARHVPAVGFVEVPLQPGLWTVKAGAEDAPVTGIRPQDAAAFAEWRSEVEEVPLRLPTEEEWLLAAGPGMDSGTPEAPPDADALRRWVRGKDGRAIDHAPSGAEGLLSDPPEYATRAESFVVKGEGEGDGILPLAPSLERADAVSQDEKRAGVGFRLVRALD